MTRIIVIAYFLSHPIEVRIASTVRGQKLMDAIVGYVQFPYPHMLRILYDGFRLHPVKTLGEQGIGDGDSVDVYMQQGGGYGAGLRLESPRDIEQISLEIALAQGVSAEYIAAPGRDFIQGRRGVIEWSGSLHARRFESLYFEEDFMQERETGDTGGAVTWEMRSVPIQHAQQPGLTTYTPLLSSLDEPDTDDVSMVKLHCDLDDKNAVVLAFNEVASYIQTVLRPLSLSYDACNSFFL